MIAVNEHIHHAGSQACHSIHNLINIVIKLAKVHHLFVFDVGATHTKS